MASYGQELVNGRPFGYLHIVKQPSDSSIMHRSDLDFHLQWSLAVNGLIRQVCIQNSWIVIL